jgi:sphingomyelin phosphodiesterase acid-like 3
MLLSRFRAIAAAVLVALAAASLGTARAVTPPFPIGPNQGVFLHISDIHFDPFADPSLVPKLVAAPVDQWESIFKTSAHTGFPHRGHDTTYPLFVSMLTAAQGAPYDYVINTGDQLAHDFKATFFRIAGSQGDYPGFVFKTLRFLNLMVQRHFPHAPLIYALGNNDAVCGDYKVAPGGAMLDRLGNDLPVVKGSPDALKDFSVGGYYAVPHPTVRRHDMIVLNSIFWSIKYWDNCNPKGGDPGAAELAWLEWTLYRERLAGRSATLIMHIPPGINAYTSSGQSCPQSTGFWQIDYSRRFLALARAYKDVLRDSYAGHTHMDNFRVLSDQSGTPFLTMRITPSVAPVFRNNPAFTVLLYDKSDAAVKDYATFYLANLDDLAGPKAQPDWKCEYTFAQTYRAPAYSPSALAALAQRIHTDPSVRASYLKYYPAASKTSPINSGNWKAFACAQTALTPAAYTACRCPGSAPH